MRADCANYRASLQLVDRVDGLATTRLHIGLVQRTEHLKSLPKRLRVAVDRWSIDQYLVFEAHNDLSCNIRDGIRAVAILNALHILQRERGVNTEGLVRPVIRDIPATWTTVSCWSPDRQHRGIG